MKRCPTCQRTYADDALNFCRADGAALLRHSSPLFEYRETLVKLPGAASGEMPTELLHATGEANTSSSLNATSSSLTAPLATPARRRTSRSRVIDSLAVLPLEDAGRTTHSSEAEYLAEGITEAIINSLTQLPRLRVTPRATVFRYKGRDPQEVGRELGVRAVLAGRLQLHGELLLVSAELIDVEQSRQVWGEQYRHEMDDIFRLQERIAHEISEKLRLRLSGEEKKRLRRRQTENTAAYHLYLKGRYFINKRTTDWIKRGVELLREAIDTDPAFADAYAGLADAYAFLASSTGEQPPTEFYPMAKAAALRALELDPTLAEAHTSLGFYRLLYEYDLEGAGHEFRRAVELKPSYANAHDGLSFYYKAVGRHERAERACRRAHEADPLSLFAHVSLAWGHHFARRYAEAVAESRKALELDPRFIFAHWSMGLAYALQGEHERAVASLTEAVEHSGGGLTFKSHLGYVYGLAGRDEEARAILSELQTVARERYVSAYYLALVHLGLGQHEEALTQLERSYEERPGFLAFLRVEPILDPLRPSPRFAALERRIFKNSDE
ncbi:MAG TPA: hypothetical protein VFX96_03510 [Pyrinomonadaceae bacterium]|nr:hypothetical protein [Pyrinomonadaceae bacterium]